MHLFFFYFNYDPLVLRNGPGIWRQNVLEMSKILVKLQVYEPCYSDYGVISKVLHYLSQIYHIVL